MPLLPCSLAPDTCHRGAGGLLGHRRGEHQVRPERRWGADLSGQELGSSEPALEEMRLFWDRNPE